MCLSPEVDVLASVAIGAFAVDALRHNQSIRTLPIAAIPTIFAVHTFASAVVWWGDRGSVPEQWANFAAQFFIAVAFVVLPIYVPLAVLSVEREGLRRFILKWFAAAGVIAGLAYAQQITLGNASAVVCNRYVDYHVSDVSALFAVLYGFATLGAVFVSSYRVLNIWGAVNVVAIWVLTVVERNGLPSLWCFWAAITSGLVAWLMRALEKRPDKVELYAHNSSP